MKDIFIDTNVTKHFKTPMTKGYDDLYKWLMENNEGNPINNAFMVVSHKIIAEYHRSNQNASRPPNILYIISLLQRQGRLNPIKNEDIKKFKANYFNAKFYKKSRSSNDLDHIPVILLSDRKMALTEDINLIYDLINFSGFNDVIAEQSPENIGYRN